MKEIGEEFMHKTGHKLSYVIGTTGALQTRLRAGEHADVIAISAEGADALAKEGRFSGAREPFARSVIAIAVKAGTPMPDISTPDKFKQTMLNAKSISISDPAQTSISGVYLLSLFEKMGIAERDEAQDAGQAGGDRSGDGDRERRGRDRRHVPERADAEQGRHRVRDVPGSDPEPDAVRGRRVVGLRRTRMRRARSSPTR